MLTQFIIIGQKDKDSYVVYDNRADFGGKACATLYTITQLIQDGYGIGGVTPEGYAWVKQGKQLKANMVHIMTVEGKVAIRIPVFADLDDTKRSASTFEKGIKRSRKEIQKAKEVGEKRSQTIQNKKDSIDPRTTDAIELYKDIMTNGAEIKRMTAQKISSIYNYSKEKEQRVYDFEQLFDKNGTPMPAYYSKSKDILVSRKKMMEKYTELIKKLNLTAEGYVQTNIMGDSTPREIVEYLLKTTKKRFLYTFGLRYRNPTTMDKSITREEAIKHYKHGMTDIREYKDYIDVNEYSGNDMW